MESQNCEKALKNKFFSLAINEINVLIWQGLCPASGEPL
jgi:hypothetical protein